MRHMCRRSLLEFQDVKELCLSLKAEAESNSARSSTDKTSPAPDPDEDTVGEAGLQIEDCVHVFAMLVRFYR